VGAVVGAVATGGRVRIRGCASAPDGIIAQAAAAQNTPAVNARTHRTGVFLLDVIILPEVKIQTAGGASYKRAPAAAPFFSLTTCMSAPHPDVAAKPSVD
jgi:hypothetical protein